MITANKCEINNWTLDFRFFNFEKHNWVPLSAFHNFKRNKKKIRKKTNGRQYHLNKHLNYVCQTLSWTSVREKKYNHHTNNTMPQPSAVPPG